MNSFVFRLQDIDKKELPLVGGKATNLGELMKIKGIQVPPGFCISTEAFKKIISETPSMNDWLHQLSLLKWEDRNKIRELSAEIRNAIETVVIPPVISEEITKALHQLGAQNAYAVRSSATAEDLPTASFAGQQDTYLNIMGKEAILEHVGKCWASLFTERAIAYRLQNGFDHTKVYLSVVVQQMIVPHAAGIMFTADPVTGNRKIVSIDASFGLGEAMVSGLVNTDHYKLRNGKVIEKKISTKTIAIYTKKEGGTEKGELDPALQNCQTLTDDQLIELEQIGRRVEQHFGAPQDIEWCLADDTFYLVQSRPITTLYPVPDAGDENNHVYISVGHQQMMTDVMKPLGLSLWQLTAAATPMYKAGGRLFVDVAPMLSSPAGRHTILNVLGRFDPLIKNALTTVLERGDFIKSAPEDKQEQPAGKSSGQPLTAYETLKDYDPSIVTDLVKRSEASLHALKQNIHTKSGSALLDFILEDKDQLRKEIADPQSMGVIMTAMNAVAWINEKMREWLGEKTVADTLSQSVPSNVTSEMGLALLDVADVIRPYPEVIQYLQQVKDEHFLEGLAAFKGGKETAEAIQTFLHQYGMRCAGEIDITRPRWSEKPATLLPVILSHIKNLEPGESKRRFEKGLQEARSKEKELLERLKNSADGAQKAEEAKRMIDLVRNLAGYREYPKYSIVNRYFVYKKALLKEAEQLVKAGVLEEKEDIYYLSFEELQEVVRTQKLDDTTISQRKEEYKNYEGLTPPRVITSGGEVITGRYNREQLPAGAIAGLAVSSGVVEGRARVMANMQEADLEEGDILVTAFTDPSWTPLFLSIKGLVTEVGGLMTHGVVIAREYGLPAIVGVENATKLIKDGQRIRVNGTEGYVEIL